MKNLVLLGFSVVTMFVSCKCKKATAEAASAETVVMEVKPGENMSEELTPATNATKAEEATTVQVTDGLEYEANTRGYHLKVKYANGQLGYTRERDSDKMQKVQLTKAQADELNALLDEVEAAKLPELKAPTEKRFYDGAAMANIHITKKGKTYSSETFDHGFPPATIEKLVKKLLSYTEEK
jgi:hypothetical protein